MRSKLGAWVQTQRVNFKKNNLSKERIAKLKKKNLEMARKINFLEKTERV